MPFYIVKFYSIYICSEFNGDTSSLFKTVRWFSFHLLISFAKLQKKNLHSSFICNVRKCKFFFIRMSKLNADHFFQVHFLPDSYRSYWLIWYNAFNRFVWQIFWNSIWNTTFYEEEEIKYYLRQIVFVCVWLLYFSYGWVYIYIFLFEMNV